MRLTKKAIQAVVAILSPKQPANSSLTIRLTSEQFLALYDEYCGASQKTLAELFELEDKVAAFQLLHLGNSGGIGRHSVTKKASFSYGWYIGKGYANYFRFGVNLDKPVYHYAFKSAESAPFLRALYEKYVGGPQAAIDWAARLDVFTTVKDAIATYPETRAAFESVFGIKFETKEKE